jgi:hypothetical protein
MAANDSPPTRRLRLHALHDHRMICLRDSYPQMRRFISEAASSTPAAAPRLMCAVRREGIATWMVRGDDTANLERGYDDMTGWRSVRLQQGAAPEAIPTPQVLARPTRNLGQYPLFRDIPPSTRRGTRQRRDFLGAARDRSCTAQRI